MLSVPQCTHSKGHQWLNHFILQHFPWSISRRFLIFPALPTSSPSPTYAIIYISHNVWLLQDLRLALGLAESVSQSTPIAAAANELYKVAKSHGLSDEDFSAVIEALKAKKWLQWWKLFFVRANTSTCLQFLTGLIIIIVPFIKFSPKVHLLILRRFDNLEKWTHSSKCFNSKQYTGMLFKRVFFKTIVKSLIYQERAQIKSQQF